MQNNNMLQSATNPNKYYFFSGVANPKYHDPVTINPVSNLIHISEKKLLQYAPGHNPNAYMTGVGTDPWKKYTWTNNRQEFNKRRNPEKYYKCSLAGTC